ncbi:polymer-forming cytoskeletal protein [bacterium]|nr:polymer-forming cytoskeletal protein [bacterium]
MFEKKMETEKVETIIGSGVKLEGTFVASGNVIVRGEVQGSLETKGDLRVEQGALVVAEVKAGNAYIAGVVKGNISVNEKLSLDKQAKIEGDIRCKSLLVEEGAEINGRCTMSDSKKEEVFEEEEGEEEE